MISSCIFKVTLVPSDWLDIDEMKLYSKWLMSGETGYLYDTVTCIFKMDTRHHSNN